MRRAIVFAVLVAAPGLVASAAAADSVLQPPVPGPIVEPFRAPLSAYGAGNRGIDYQPPPGTEVRAAADGRVRFAGPVAHELWVTVEHADGLKTSYGPLASMLVSQGQAVSTGEPIGTSTDHVHFGVRKGDAYVDPAPLLIVTLHARLVPTGEEEWFEQHRSRGGLLSRAVGWLRHAGQVLTGGSGACTKAGAPLPPPPTDAVVILIAGYGSNGHSSAGIEHLDVVGAGFDPSSVLRFSYVGGRVPDPSDAVLFAPIPSADYESSDSQRPIEDSALALAQLIEQVRALAPARPIDLVAHSQGGLVALSALHDLADHEGLRVVTIGSPHQGDTLAGTIGIFTDIQPRAELALDIAEASGLTGAMQHDSPSPREMMPTSAFMDAYRRNGVPADVPVTSVAGRWDLIVTAPDAKLDGAANIVVDGSANPLGAHDALPGTPEVTREVTLAARGLPPSCQGFGGRVVDRMVGRFIRGVEAVDPIPL